MNIDEKIINYLNKSKINQNLISSPYMRTKPRLTRLIELIKNKSKLDLDDGKIQIFINILIQICNDIYISSNKRYTKDFQNLDFFVEILERTTTLTMGIYELKKRINNIIPYLNETLNTKNKFEKIILPLKILNNLISPYPIDPYSTTAPVIIHYLSYFNEQTKIEQFYKMMCKKHNLPFDSNKLPRFDNKTIYNYQGYVYPLPYSYYTKYDCEKYPGEYLDYKLYNRKNFKSPVKIEPLKLEINKMDIDISSKQNTRIMTGGSGIDIDIETLFTDSDKMDDLIDYTERIVLNFLKVCDSVHDFNDGKRANIELIDIIKSFFGTVVDADMVIAKNIFCGYISDMNISTLEEKLLDNTYDILFHLLLRIMNDTTIFTKIIGGKLSEEQSVILLKQIFEKSSCITRLINNMLSATKILKENTDGVYPLIKEDYSIFKFKTSRKSWDNVNDPNEETYLNNLTRLGQCALNYYPNKKLHFEASNYYGYTQYLCREIGFDMVYSDTSLWDSGSNKTRPLHKHNIESLPLEEKHGEGQTIDSDLSNPWPKKIGNINQCVHELNLQGLVDNNRKAEYSLHVIEDNMTTMVYSGKINQGPSVSNLSENNANIEKVFEDSGAEQSGGNLCHALFLKRSGDWTQVDCSVKNQLTIVTFDRLCALYAIYKECGCIFTASKQGETYVILYKGKSNPYDLCFKRITEYIGINDTISKMGIVVDEAPEEITQLASKLEDMSEELFKDFLKTAYQEEQQMLEIYTDINIKLDEYKIHIFKITDVLYDRVKNEIIDKFSKYINNSSINENCQKFYICKYIINKTDITLTSSENKLNFLKNIFNEYRNVLDIPFTMIDFTLGEEYLEIIEQNSDKMIEEYNALQKNMNNFTTKFYSIKSCLYGTLKRDFLAYIIKKEGNHIENVFTIPLLTGGRIGNKKTRKKYHKKKTHKLKPKNKTHRYSISKKGRTLIKSKHKMTGGSGSATHKPKALCKICNGIWTRKSSKWQCNDCGTKYHYSCLQDENRIIEGDNFSCIVCEENEKINEEMKKEEGPATEEIEQIMCKICSTPKYRPYNTKIKKHGYCDKCGNYFHLKCIKEEGSFNTSDDWYCPICLIVEAEHDITVNASEPSIIEIPADEDIEEQLTTIVMTNVDECCDFKEGEEEQQAALQELLTALEKNKNIDYTIIHKFLDSNVPSLEYLMKSACDFLFKIAIIQFIDSCESYGLFRSSNLINNRPNSILFCYNANIDWIKKDSRHDGKGNMGLNCILLRHIATLHRNNPNNFYLYLIKNRDIEFMNIENYPYLCHRITEYLIKTYTPLKYRGFFNIIVRMDNIFHSITKMTDLKKKNNIIKFNEIKKLVEILAVAVEHHNTPLDPTDSNSIFYNIKIICDIYKTKYYLENLPNYSLDETIDLIEICDINQPMGVIDELSQLCNTISYI